MEELINTGQSDVVGRLAFKYMMCTVDSSSDSETDTNPRWSDVSTKGWENSAPESREAPERLQKNYQQCLDPYDGSSEDSGSSDGGVPKRRPRGPVRRRAGIRDHPDVLMRSSSDSETQSHCWPEVCVRLDLSDSGIHTRSGLSSPAPDPFPSGSRALPKRKLFPSGELEEGMRRKRRCTSDMEI
ncbi:uncharacterized protein LOC143731069 isoform X2 [Siphateles boraxobius]|uniref:uncharacterized protein LOC143731069 isoform X2 n=1 Tax=Siphateles boraxobius TaxID=180520 RepID=UPI0040640FAB